jgi:hypothetical protein
LGVIKLGKKSEFKSNGDQLMTELWFSKKGMTLLLRRGEPSHLTPLKPKMRTIEYIS